MSFTDELKKAAEKDVLRLHTPGHKGDLSALDLTELTDGSFPYAALDTAQKRAADVYGARHARFLCGGSSQGVKAAALFASVNAVADINSHRSVFDGFALCGKTVVTAGKKGNVLPLTVKDIAGALTPDTQAVVLTSPTYYGFCADVDGIGEFCKRRGLIFIVDSAHGAHFGFGTYLPASVAPRCDICNVSAHKTLFALTQSALLLDNLSDSDSARLNECADVMGSTSPSYLLYASIDYAVAKAAEDKTRAAYDALYEPVTELAKRFPFMKNDDYTRLVLDTAEFGVDAAVLNSALCRRGVYSELVDESRIVFLLTAQNTSDDVCALAAALTDSIRETV